MSWESPLLAFLSASLVRPLFLVVAALLILWMFRVRHPASLYAVWTAVLLGMLLLPLISVMSPRINLPVLPAKNETFYTVQPLPSPEFVQPRRMASQQPIALRAPSLQPVKARWNSLSLLTWLYLAGVLAMAGRAALGWLLMRRVVSRSRPLRGPLRESSDLVVPVAAGLLHPVVILPSGWRAWSRETRRAVLAHEFAHIRRRDAIGAALGRLAKCVFWFHPLAWAVSRKVAELAELACDAAALKSVRDPSAYSRVLLQFAGGVTAAGHRTILPGLAMANSSGLRRRIDRVFELSDGNMRKLVRPGLILASLGVPVICLAATVGLKERTRVSPAVSQVAPQVTPPPVTLAQAPSPVPVPVPVPSPAKPTPMLTPAFDTMFDKATIEIAGPPVSGELCWGGCGGPGTPYPESPNEITYRHFTLKKILLRAYDLKDFQIVVPDEFNALAYTIQATAPVGTSKEQFQLMLRNLLAEKLRLTLHYETKDLVSNYDLVISSGGLKLKESVAENTPVSARGLVMVPSENGFTRVRFPSGGAVHSLSMLASVLAFALQTPVDDKTGLTGNYDLDPFELPATEWPYSAIRIPKRNTSLPAVNARLEPLGLVLEEKESPMDVLVIDHVDPVLQ